MSQPQLFMLETTVSSGHSHCSKVDTLGNGITTIDSGHQHQVLKGVAQPLQGGDMHMHGLTQSMCRHDPQRGWGKAGCGSCGKR